jgi:hypothetical protein
MNKYGFIPTVLLTFLIICFCISANSQMTYNDLMDLNTICKKEDFTAAKNFLENQNMKIEEFKINYDHGSYFVLGHIKASKESEEIPTNEIEIDFKEFSDYKLLSIFQSILSKSIFDVSEQRNQPLWNWANENWTSVIISKKDNPFEAVLGKQFYSFSEDTSAKLVSVNELSELLKKEKFSNKVRYSAFFLNANPLLGDVKYNILNFQPLPEIPHPDDYSCSLLLQTRFLKGINVSKSNSKIISFPLVLKGKVYSLNLKFGNLIKTYIFDSGASDMSIDNETYQYFENSDQLKIENRLSDAEYQLADGTIIKLKKLKVPQFSINGVVIKNIESTIVENGRPLLLGKSFLDNFKSWKIDNENQVLIVEQF